MKQAIPRIILIFLLLFGQPAGTLAWPDLTRPEREFDHALSDFGGMLQFSRRINPDAGAERRKFFAARERGENYEPQFHYQPLPEKLHRASRELQARPLPDGAWSGFLAAARTELLQKYRVLCHRGGPRFTAEAVQLHPLPDPALVFEAQRLLRLTRFTDRKSHPISPAAMQELLTAALQQFSLSGWRVILSGGMSARASVLSGSRKVKINQAARFYRSDAERLIHHELGVHAVRAERGRQMPLRIFQTGLAGYLDTEEGLAAWTEMDRGITAGLRLFALRVLAVHWAAGESFSQVYRRLLTLGAAPGEAWTLTLRAKRGLRDTGRPGCWPKDAVYLRGYRKLQNFVRSGGRIRELKRFGKIGLADLETMHRLRILP